MSGDGQTVMVNYVVANCFNFSDNSIQNDTRRRSLLGPVGQASCPGASGPGGGGMVRTLLPEGGVAGARARPGSRRLGRDTCAGRSLAGRQPFDCWDPGARCTLIGVSGQSSWALDPRQDVGDLAHSLPTPAHNTPAPLRAFSPGTRRPRCMRRRTGRRLCCLLGVSGGAIDAETTSAGDAARLCACKKRGSRGCMQGCCGVNPPLMHSCLHLTYLRSLRRPLERQPNG